MLRGEQGEILRLASRRHGRSPGVARALHHIHRHLDERLDLTTLARVSRMSVSSLHHQFKEATTLSPKQYVKSLRLDRARQMMLDDGIQAAEAAFRVGYESPSQFSREFKRWFGASPRQYLAEILDAGIATMNARHHASSHARSTASSREAAGRERAEHSAAAPKIPRPASRGAQEHDASGPPVGRRPSTRPTSAR